jgi:hypothetical protein
MFDIQNSLFVIKNSLSSLRLTAMKIIKAISRAGLLLGNAGPSLCLGYPTKIRRILKRAIGPKHIVARG